MEANDNPSDTQSTLPQRAVFFIKYALVLVWGLLCTLAFLLPAILLWGNTSVASVFAQTLSWGGLKILGIRVDVKGKENLAKRPAIIIANHQSNYDIVLIGAIYPRNTVIIAKREILRIPLLGLFFAATGNIMIDRGDRKEAVAGLDKAVDMLRTRRTSIWIFPEGHRSRGTGLGPFKKGAFHMAIAAGVPVIPIVCSSADRLINARTRSAPGGVFNIRILPPIPTLGLQPGDVEQLKDAAFAQLQAEWEQLEGKQTPDGLTAIPPAPSFTAD